jgi:hypothetical protein
MEPADETDHTAMIIASTKLKGLALLFVTFVAGGAGGVAVDRTWLRPASTQAVAISPERLRGLRQNSAEPESERIPFPLEALQPSPEETAKLHAIARRWRPQAARAIESIRANVSDLENNMFAEMLCVISKEKQDRYLAQLEENGGDRVLIDKRFALVRSNRCDEVKRESEPRR